jgi:hypothetical protein
MLLCGLVLPGVFQDLLAWNYAPHKDFVHRNLDKSAKKFSFRITANHDASGSDDDNLWQLKVDVKNANGSYVRIFEMYGVNHTNPTSWSFINLDGTSDSEYHYRYKGFGGASPSVSKSGSGDYHYAHVSLTLPENLRYLNNYEFRVYVNHEDKGSNYSAYDYFNLSGWTPIQAPYINTTQSQCGQVTLSWSGTGSDHRYSIRKRFKGETSWSGWSSPQSATSYIDYFTPSAQFPNHEREYEFKVGYGSSLKNGNTKNNISGKSPKVLDPPNPSSTINNCDTTIDVSWTWSGANPKGFKLAFKKDNVIYQTPLISGGTRAYTIDENFAGNNLTIEPNEFYDISILSVNECDVEGASTTIQGKWMDDPDVPTNFAAIDTTIENERVIYLTWDDNAVNESRYVIKKTLFGGATSEYIYLEEDQEFYVDNNTAICNKYIYELFAQNICTGENDGQGIVHGDPIEKVLTFDMQNSFVTDNNFEGSKGYFPNYVELKWATENNSNLIEQFKVYRRQLGSNGNYSQIASENSGTHIFYDETASAGTLYEYMVIGEAQCLTQTVYTDTIRGVGFRNPSAIVNGQVNYTGGIAVDGVKVLFETSSNSGKSIEFDGSSHLLVKNDFKNSGNNQEFYLESWIKPDNDSTFDIYNKTDIFKFAYQNNGFTFTSGAQNPEVIIPTSLTQNQWQHIGLRYNNDSLYLFVNGNLSNKVEYTNTIALNSTEDLLVGNNFEGWIEELRLWNTAPADSLINRDYSRFINGDEIGLITYIRFDEISGNYSYDLSHEGPLYHKNDAQFIGSITRSTNKPTLSQLAYAAYTNNLGSYSILIPFSGTGQNFTVTPSLGTHQFSPATTALFLGDGSIVNNGVDFEDISSFVVTGTVFFKNSSCPSKDVQLYIDGEPVIANGYPVTTGDDGAFEINVPIGNHIVEAKKLGHTMSSGRFPVTGTYDFQEEVSGIEFADSTFKTIVGRVVGGKRGTTKVPGFNNSKNNIGVAEVIFESQLGGGCYRDTVLTDSLSGEYVIQLPPLKFIPEVSIPSNAGISFEDLDLITILSNQPSKTTYDTVYAAGDSIISHVDSFEYHYLQDYVYQVDPEFSVTREDGINPFIGDTSFTYTVNNEDTTFSLVQNPFTWPVFSLNKDVKDGYVMLIKVFEKYENRDKTPFVNDSVPARDGTIKILNGFTNGGLNTIELNKLNTVDTIYSLIYRFFPNGVPSFLENTSIPEYSYTNTIELYVDMESRPAVHWKPVTNPSDSLPDVFRGYLLGGVSVGNQFVTNGPDNVEFILRDPPGSGSSATRSKGSVSSSNQSWGYAATNSGEQEHKIALGAKFSAGLGVSVETEISNDLTLGLKSKISLERNGSLEVTNTSEKSWSTDDGSDQTGAGSDLFMGKSQNVEFGIVKNLVLVPSDDCPSVNCIGNPMNGFSLGEKNRLSVVPGGYDTYFIYSQNHIKNYLIPDIIQLRNALIQSDSKYVSHLDIDDPNYGKSNDDPAFGAGKSTNTPDVRELNDNTGLSYTYTPVSGEDSIKDKLWSYNHQIRKWEEVLRENEWEKVIIDNSHIRDSLKNYELEELDKKNALFLAIYDELTQNEIENGLRTHIYSMIPGGPVPGGITFAKTAAFGIATAELTKRYKEYWAERNKILRLFGKDKSNYSISGGSSFTSTETSERAITSSTTMSYEMDYSTKYEITAKVNGTGTSVNFNTAFGFSRSRSKETGNTSSEGTEFTLADGDQGDYMSVDVFPSILGYGPIFKLKEGGRTSCPFEDEIVTEYYNPGTVISAKTLQRDKPSVSVSPSIVQNVPMEGAAVFNLTLGNVSESNDAREYNYQIVSSTNPYGAIIKIDGVIPEGTVAINGNSSFNKTLTIEKGPGPVFQYDSILFIITAPCQYEAGTSDNLDIADSVYFSAHFIPGCSKIDISSPGDKWVLNNSFNNELPLVIKDYDINFQGLERFRVDYKPSNQSSWIGLQSFYKDTAGVNDPNAKLIPTNSTFTLYDWDVSQLTDGNYDIRVKTDCDLAYEESATLTGVIDRVNPHSFGSPSPGDGILNADEDISITFNEDIESGSLSLQNFDIRGVLNGSEIRHQVSPEFNGSTSYIEIPSGLSLQNRDFTIEFWAKNTTGNDGIFFAQGPGALEGMKIGTSLEGKIYFEIAGSRVYTDDPVTDIDQWHHYAFAYNIDNETLEILIDGNLKNVNSVNLYSKFIGSGKILLGKSTFGQEDHLTGNIHDLRIWNHTRSLSEVVANMNIQVGKQNIGLLHNWKMDEATGNQIEDHVRFRNGILNNITWTLNPGGYAMKFEDDNSQGYVLTSSNISFTDEMDFTLEFWFRSNSSGVETLFSNGKGDGLGADSLSSWSITKIADGSVHLMHYGKDIEIVPTGSIDGNWHHLAIVLNRTSVLSSYLDGQLQKTEPASSFKEFGAAKLAIGSRYYQNGTQSQYDQFFNGSIDEFRIWGLNRSQKQIERDMRFKLQGNEIGLVSYIPFEKYEKNLGVYILIEDLTDQADTSHHETHAVNSLISNTPKIKLPRPIEKVNFNYAVNGDKVILTPTSPPHKIENVTLDISVKDVLDLHGNKMQSPATWIAYPDKNQIVWETDLVQIDILKDQGYSFSKKIVNSSGAAKNFTLSNIPSWLTVSTTAGLIEPGSTFEISFTVVEDVNIGSYKEDIIVQTDFGYPERLTVDLKVRGQEPNWDVNPSDFEKSMSVIGSIAINDVVSIDAEDILYVFINDECRGKANLQHIESIDKYLLFLDVYSNSSAADTLTFKIWDASSGSIFVDVTPSDLTFVTDGLTGSLLSPQQFSAFSKIQENTALQPGWNWVSFHLNTPDTAHLENLLSSLDLQEGDQIKTLGNNTFATYSQQFGWLGNIKTTGVSLSKGYKIKVSKNDTLISLGDVVNPTLYPIALQSGWNWIGFVSIRPMNVNVALGSLTATSGDLIKGRAQFSIYDSQMGWIGSLNTLFPNQSYMYNSKNNSETSFTFPFAGGFKSEELKYEEISDERWPVDFSSAISNMNAIVELDKCENPIDFSSWYLGFFDGTGTCRALSSLQQVEGKNLAFVTAVGNDNLDLTPRLLNKESGLEINLKGSIQYQANSLKGSYTNPVEISMDEKDCKLFYTPEDEQDLSFNSNIEVYPSIFTNQITIQYQSELADDLSIELINALGQTVRSFSRKVTTGDNKLVVNQKLESLPAGAYILKISDQSTSQNLKIVKKN